MKYGHLDTGYKIAKTYVQRLFWMVYQLKEVVRENKTLNELWSISGRDKKGI